MPDAAAYGDEGCDTLGNIARVRGLTLPHLTRLGLANIRPLAGMAAAAAPEGSFGKCAMADLAGQGHHDGALGDGGNPPG